MTGNPFVGPEPLQTGQSIFGRDREIEELYYLLGAERIVLLHSPSGAGKSSLVQAGLVPRLADRFDVWGPLRVNVQPPDGVGNEINRYVRSAILCCEEAIPEARQRPKEPLSRMTLSEYVAGRPRRRNAPPHVMLIFDQFEEILTADPLAFDAKREFFDQLGELLQDPKVWALFALREDYLAPLDPYANRVPTHLKNRFRIDLLSREAAGEAIVYTAASGGLWWTEGTVGKLVEDLASMQVQRSDGTFETQPGPYVEPLHLQVACRSLWERLPDDKLVIDDNDIHSFGDVSTALAQYYEDQVDSMPGPQRAIREWVGEKLIRNGVRCQVLRGAGASEGLSNGLIERLVDSHLVRAEQRAGAVWYELAHDRLIEPVRSSNEAWFDENLTKVEKLAALWDAQDFPPGLLLRDAELVEAQRWAEEQPALEDVEKKFLAASADAQAAADKERRQARRLRLLAIVAMAVSWLALIAMVVAWRARAEATKQHYMSVWQSAARQATNDLPDHTNDDRSALLARQSFLLFHNTPDQPRYLVERALQSALHLTGFAHVFSGHHSGVQSVAFVGNRLLSASLGQIIGWDLNRPNTSPQVFSPSGYGSVSVALAPDGNHVATGLLGEVRVWDLHQPAARPQVLAGPERQAMFASVAFAPDGNHVAAGSYQTRTVCVWDLRQPNSPPQVLSGHRGSVGSVAFSPDGNQLASGSEDTTVRVWDLRQPNAPPRVLSGHQGPVRSVAFSPGNIYVASGSTDKTVRLWDIRERDPVGHILPGHQGSINSVAFSPYLFYLASASEDNTVRVWNLQAPGTTPQVFSWHQGAVNSVAFASDSNRVASAGADATVRVWELDKIHAMVHGHMTLPEFFQGRQGSLLYAVTFSADGAYLAYAGHDPAIRVWDLSRSTSRLLEGHRGFVSDVVFARDSKHLASVGGDNTVRIWDLRQSSPLQHTFTSLDGEVGSAAFAPDDNHLTSVAVGGKVRVWDLRQPNALPQVFSGPGSAINPFAFAHDGNRVASATRDKTVLVWDFRRPNAVPLVIRQASDSVAFSPDSHSLALGRTVDGTVHLWNLRQPKTPPLVLPGYQIVSSIAFSSDGSRLASGSEDKTVHIWDLRQPNAPPQILPGDSRMDQGPINAVAFSPDGNQLATASDDGNVRLWPLWKAAADLLCQRVWRNLSMEEWNFYIGAGIPYERTCPNLPPGLDAPSR